MPTYSTFVEKFFTALDALLSSYVFDGYQALSNMMQGPLAAIATLYIVIFGLSVMNGWVKVNMGEFVKSVLKLGLIYTAVSNWGWVSSIVITSVYSGIDAVSGALIKASPLHIPGFNDVNSALQEVLIEFMMIAQLFFKSGGWSNIAATIQGWGVEAIGYVMVAIAVFEITLSKIMLAILFALMPVFVCFCFFKSTKGFFDRYVGVIVSNAFVLVMVNAVLILGLQLVYWAFPVLEGQSALNIGFLGVVPIMLVAFIVIATLMKVGGVAHSLGGSIASASGSAMLGGMIGGAMGSALSGMHLLKNTGRAAGVMGSFVKNGAAQTAGSLKQGLSGAKSIMQDMQSKLRGGGE